MNTRKDRMIIITITLAVMFCLPALALYAAEYEIKYAHFQPEKMDQPQHVAAMVFKNFVEQQSGGRIEVIIYPASQLGDDKEILEGLKFGTVEMASVHDGPIPTVFKPAAIFGIPYIFDSPPIAWRVMDGWYGEKLNKAMIEQTGIRALAWSDNGVRNFSANKPLQTPADLQGVKMRVMVSEVYVKMVEALGGSPTPVAWPELYTALQQGVVDGQENGVTNMLAANLFEVQKYYMLDGHIYSVHVVLIGNKFFESLPKDLQEIVQKGAEIGKIVERGLVTTQDILAKEILGEKGMEIVPFTPEQKAEFRKLSQPPVVEWVKTQTDPQWVEDLFKAIEEAQAAIAAETE